MSAQRLAYKIIGSDDKGFDVVQMGINGPWWHSVQRGLWPTEEAATEWARQHAGSRPYRFLEPDECIYTTRS